MAFEIKHYHYTGLPEDIVHTLALFKVFKDGALVAVIREPEDFALIGEPIPNKNYRVDCCDADDELEQFIQEYFPGKTFAYFRNGSKWHWRDNGTYEEMPWSVEPDSE
jgi:hypothetical protein